MNIRNEWETMLSNNIMPYFEIQIGEDEYLLVDIELADDNTCLLFSFDKEDLFDVSFSGEIEVTGLGYYRLPVDNDFSLDIHLQTISQEMLEGYILPNNLYFEE